MSNLTTLAQKQRELIAKMGGITMACGCSYDGNCKLARPCNEHKPYTVRKKLTTLYTFTYRIDSMDRTPRRYYASKREAERDRVRFNKPSAVEPRQVPVSRRELADFLTAWSEGDFYEH